MALPALRCLRIALLVLLLATPASACFGPKLFIGTATGIEGELRFHLVAIYLHEKTGIDSTRIELAPGRNALQAIAANEIDLGFGAEEPSEQPVLLRLDDKTCLYSGPRPLTDLQFTTVGRSFERLRQRLDRTSLAPVRERIAKGALPATAVREFLLEQGWI